MAEHSVEKDAPDWYYPLPWHPTIAERAVCIALNGGTCPHEPEGYVIPPASGGDQP